MKHTNKDTSWALLATLTLKEMSLYLMEKDITTLNKVYFSDQESCGQRMSALSIPATMTGFFIASLRKGSPSS
jgi:hypothetical protein